MSNSWLLVTILLMLVVEPFLSPEMSRRWAFDLMVSAVLVAALSTVGRRSRSFVAGLLLAAPALVGAWALHVTESPILVASSLVFSLAFFTFMVVVLLRRVLESTTVTNDTIAGALSAYLLLAVVWAMTFALIETLHPGSFEIGGEPLTSDSFGHESLIHRFLYLSLVTLTTVGYGDMLPVTAVARRFAALEAVIGQLYLAVLISRLVALQVSAPDRPAAGASADGNTTRADEHRGT